MDCNPNVANLKVGYNPFTSHLLTSGDIQVADVTPRPQNFTGAVCMTIFLRNDEQISSGVLLEGNFGNKSQVGLKALLQTKLLDHCADMARFLDDQPPFRLISMTLRLKPKFLRHALGGENFPT